MIKTRVVLDRYESSENLLSLNDEQYFISINDRIREACDKKLDLIFQYYLKSYENIRSSLFLFFSNELKNNLNRELIIFWLVIQNKMKRDNACQRKEPLKFLASLNESCLRKLDQLNGKNQVVQRCSLDNPGKYLGIELGQLYASAIYEISSAKTKVVKDLLNAINSKRQYWVYTGGLLNQVMGMIPDNFYHIHQAKRAVKSPSIVTGHLSYLLYYIRFFINLSLLLKHTIKGPWMSKDEKNISTKKRFLSEWEQRKFILINDSVWATANLLTFFWLVGQGVKGTAGTVLNTVLLGMDLAISFWAYHEQKAKFLKNKQSLLRDRELLQEKLNNNKKNPLISEKLRSELNRLNDAILKCRTDWNHTRSLSFNSMAYALGLLLFSALATLPKLSQHIPMFLTFIGAAASFAVMVICSGITAIVKSSQTRASIKDADALYEKLLERFREPNIDENERKCLYIQLKEAYSESQYHRGMLRYNTAVFFRSVLIDAMMPAVMFSATVFLSLGWAIGVIALAITIAIVTKTIIDKKLKPKKAQEAVFDEDNYNAFKNNPSREKIKEIIKSDTVNKRVPSSEIGENESEYTDIEDRENLNLMK